MIWSILETRADTVFPHIVAAATIQGRKLFKGGKYCFMVICDTLALLKNHFNQLSKTLKSWQKLWVFSQKSFIFRGNVLEKELCNLLGQIKNII